MKTVIIIASALALGVFAYQYGPSIVNRFRTKATGPQQTTGPAVVK